MTVSKRKTGVERAERKNLTAGVNVQLLHSLGSIPADCVDSVIVSPSIESLIVEAQSGDKAAAKRLLALAGVYMKHDMYGPLPPPLRRYLGNALLKASLGESADVTLNLKRDGRPRQDHRTKLRIAHRIHKGMQKGHTLEAASYELGEMIQANIRKYGKFCGYTKAPDSKTLEGIYSEVLPEIEAIYEEVLRCKST
jgi:hypothetical protein